jgi:hypothetical protein
MKNKEMKNEELRMKNSPPTPKGGGHPDGVPPLWEEVRKGLFLILLAFASCEQKDEVTPPARAVGFSGAVQASVSVGTRADTDYRGWGMMNTAALQTKGFGVYCWYTGTDNFDTEEHAKESRTYVLMNNQEVTYDGSAGKWDYSPSKYWPLEATEKLTFRAYAPYSSTGLSLGANGTPLLQVEVAADDYCNDHQQDPLWGTSNYVSGEHSMNNTYGTPYDNFTYMMSGSELVPDERDGTIDWYFHHGMALFALQAQLVNAPTEGTAIRITGIHTGPFYNKGKLDIFNSQTANSGEKPVWTDRAGDPSDIYVDVRYHHDPDGMGTYLHDDLTGVPLSHTAYSNVAVNGLLAIPRDYTVGTGMEVTVTYEEYFTGSGDRINQKTATGYVKMNVEGNTIYWLQLTLNAEKNTLYVRSFVNLNWQVGAYDRREI